MVVVVVVVVVEGHLVSQIEGTRVDDQEGRDFSGGEEWW